MRAVVRRIGMTCFIVLSARVARADLWVDCTNGNDANTGASATTAVRTINEAMRRLDPQPATVHVAAGTCPSENGIFLRPKVTLRCAGATATRIEDTLYFGSETYAADDFQPHAMTVEGCSFSAGYGGLARPDLFSEYFVTLRRSTVGPGSLVMQEAGNDSTPETTVEDSTLADLATDVVSSGLTVTLRRSTVSGLLDVFAASDSIVRLEDSRVTRTRLFGYIDAHVHRTRFVHDGGSAIEMDGFNQPPAVFVSSSLFQGHDCGICGFELGTLVVENSTFIRMHDAALEFRYQGFGDNSRFVGNSVHDVEGDALRLGEPLGTTHFQIRRNNFSRVDGAIVCTAPGVCLSSVHEVDAQSWAEDDRDDDPGFENDATGNFHLRSDSPLVDGAQLSTEALLQPLDLDGTTRPVDGDLDGDRRSDIGAFEFADGDADRVPDYRDRCRGTGSRDAVDLEGCSIAQLCPCSGPWSDHGAYVACVDTNSARFETQGWITGKERARIKKSAAQSSCGKR